MLKPSLATVVTLLVVTTTAAGVGVSTNEPPLVDAGLDQEVAKGATVHLDGTGSRDPDGDVGHHRWTIRTPNNATIAPECQGCPRTSFAPTEVGRYNVTLTVTDDGGATRSDTLYVDVSPGTPPDISLSGSQEPNRGDSTTYVAALDSGAAALDHVVWEIGTVEIANHSVSAEQKADTITRRFPTTGSRTITATVYDVDNQTDASSLEVTAQAESNPSSDSPDRSSSTSIADRTSPVVDGDAVVTGGKPLRGWYDVRLDAAATNVESIKWQNTTTRVGSGSKLTRTWEPGNHELYAVVSYTDGSENIATFANGSTSVVADPRPNASFVSLDRFGAASGTVTGVDEYGNLKTLRVAFDGETVATAPPTYRGRHRFDTYRQQTLEFSHYEFTPGERYQVTVIAVDDRGQISCASREIVPVKEPEIVKSEFVNGPVDSYHERIDPERYTARHVLKIDLNGVNRENISTHLYEKTENSRHIKSEKWFDNESGILQVNSSWVGDYPGMYKSGIRYRVNDNLDLEHTEIDRFEVTPSKPELRIEVLNDGTEDYITRDHGILVDASESFDPDKTDLKYIWKHGATPTKPDNTTAKFSTYQRAASIVEDQYDLRTKRSLDFLDNFLPEVTSREVVSSGPYASDEMVRLRIETEPYFFSKVTYYDDFALGISTDHPQASIEKWERVPASGSGHSDATEQPYRHVGIVEIPASALSSTSQKPKITVYNEGNDRKEEVVEFPEVGVLAEDGRYWTNVSVIDVSYVLEKPEMQEVTVDSSRRLNKYLLQGYTIDERQRETEYVLEEQVKVADAKYETETKNFSTRRTRELFLSSEWYASGTNRKEVTRTKTETRWQDSVSNRPELRDSNLWNGEFTGDTRRVVVEPAEYRTEKRYEYEYEVEKTGTRTITKTRMVSVERTGTRTTTRCLRGLGCYETTQTYTYYTTERRSYTITRTYTYTVTRTGTYWTVSGSRVNGQFTGDTRRVKMEDAVYGTEYEIREKTQYTDSILVYEASRNKLVQPAKYEWQTVQTTSDGRLAYRIANVREDWRMGRSETVTAWKLTKQTGTERVESGSYTNEENVIKTLATIEGDLVQQYVNKQTGERTKEQTEEKITDITYNEVKTPWEVREILSHKQ